MKESGYFGTYIQQKRKEAGLTQKALAEKLCVTESAVSKWERNLSYPDITLVTTICEVLNITEHELLTASDDIHQREVEIQAHKYKKMTMVHRKINWIIYCGYVAALIPTFIWGLVSGKGLGVFFIVLASLCIAFSVVNLPCIVKQHRPQKVFWSLYGSLIFLLAVCRLVNVGASNEHWFIMAVLGVSLGLLGGFLPFILRSVESKHPIFSHTGFVCMAIDTILVYLLVFFGCLFYSDNANVIANNLTATTIFAIGGWAIFVICRYAKLSRLLKGGIAIEIIGWYLFFANSICECVFDGIRFSLRDTFVLPSIDFGNWSECTNANVGCIVIIAGVVMIVGALIRDLKNRYASQK